MTLDFSNLRTRVPYLAKKGKQEVFITTGHSMFVEFYSISLNPSVRQQSQTVALLEITVIDIFEKDLGRKLITWWTFVSDHAVFVQAPIEFNPHADGPGMSTLWNEAHFGGHDAGPQIIDVFQVSVGISIQKLKR